MKTYYIKAYNKKTAKSVEANGIVIDSVFDQINWCGIRLTSKEKQMIQIQVNQFYDFEFSLRDVVARICFSDIRQSEVDHGLT